MSVLIMREYMLFYEEIYTTGKNFTLPLAVLAVTNLTSASLHLSNGLRLGEKSKSKSKLGKVKAPKSAGGVASCVTLALVA